MMDLSAFDVCALNAIWFFLVFCLADNELDGSRPDHKIQSSPVPTVGAN
jgi:hypothetical protein